jgi:hypothetical protein
MLGDVPGLSLAGLADLESTELVAKLAPLRILDNIRNFEV